MKTFPLLKAIFMDCDTPLATVEAQTIVGSNRPYFEPVLKFMESIAEYNCFRGPKVVAFLRKHLHANNRQGKIVSIRFGRAYSPVLYLTMSRADYQNGDYRTLSYQERVRQEREFLKLAKKELDPDEASIEGHVIRLWWD